MSGFFQVVGIDEVGRGSLAGPVIVGAVSLGDYEKRLIFPDLEKLLKRPMADSKKLFKQQREKAAAFLEARIDWAVGSAEAGEIDELGLTAAITQAAGRALDTLTGESGTIERLWADAGLRHPYEDTIPTKRVIRGDEQIAEIMFASVIAKVYRDRLMEKLDAEFLGYGWARNAGYGTAAHRQALREMGPTPQHRQLFLRKLDL